MQKKTITKIQKVILDWYTQHGREGLPWRETDDLYKIAVSEIMLQQTNVPKVIEKYKAFLNRFPTVEKLARARQSSVVHAWQGLGYNRRAVNLHKMAKVVVREYAGLFPQTAEELVSLPGIGPYTKNAILAFGLNRDVSAVDVNIERFVRRVYGMGAWEKIEHPTDVIAAFVPLGRSRDWHNALMDFASGVCTKRTPDCQNCPLKYDCASFPDPQDSPVPKKKEVGRSEGGKHIPRRIYRGRIVEYLRMREGTAMMIGQSIKKDWSADDRTWLEEILNQLAKEGMIVSKDKKWKLK